MHVIGELMSKGFDSMRFYEEFLVENAQKYFDGITG